MSATREPKYPDDFHVVWDGSRPGPNGTKGELLPPYESMSSWHLFYNAMVRKFGLPPSVKETWLTKRGRPSSAGSRRSSARGASRPQQRLVDNRKTAPTARPSLSPVS